MSQNPNLDKNKKDDEYLNANTDSNLKSNNSSIDYSNQKSKEYHTFKLRGSIMDVLIEKSRINQSEFKGFYNLIMSLLIMWVFTLPIFNYINNGYFIKTNVFERMIKDLSILIFVWPFFHFWTYLAYVLQIMILKKYPSFICKIFEYFTQFGIFIFTSYFCLKVNWFTSQIIFTLTQSIVHFFKMISYTQVNRDYRQDYLKKLKTGEKQISSYPNNINFVNFFYFLRAPTFVYEETYPRTSKFKIKYFILKVLKAFFNITLMYYIYTEHIEITIPVMLTTSIFELIIRLYFPICLWCFFTFYLIFECVLPAYAELATFGDRLFYDDWWNSTDLEEFNRRWNKIVHQFLHRHVYLECLNYYKLSATASKLLTFIFSALLHEYCLCIVIKLFRPYMFVLMMIQLPILAFGKKYLKNTTGGNFFFWYSVLIGNCLIFILYNTAYLLENGHN